MASRRRELKVSRFTLETIKPDLSLPKHYLSATQVSMYLKCPKQYEFRYIDKLIIPPAVALVEGICHHDALEMDNDHKYEHGDNLRTSIVIEKFIDEFMTQKKGIPKESWINSGDTVDNILKNGNMLISEYHRCVAASIVPSNPPERKVELVFGGIPMMAFIDVEDKENIIDYKVSSHGKIQSDIDNDLQLAICSKGAGKRNVVFCNFIKTKTPTVKLLESNCGDGRYKVAEAIIKSVADAIRKGSFPMCDTTNTFPCSKKWCGYWNICIGKLIKGE